MIILSFLLLPKISLAGISSVSVVDDTVFDNKGKNWLISWTADYSDYVTATYTKDDLKRETGVDAERGFTLSLIPGDEYDVYYLYSPMDVVEVELIEEEKFWGWNDEEAEQWALRNCADLNGDGIYNYGHKGWKLYCFHRKSITGQIYKIKKVRNVFSVKWKFKPEGGQEETYIISNDHNTHSGLTTKIDNKIYIRWKGSFSSHYYGPEVGEERATISRAGQFFIVDSDVYTNWKNKIRDDGIDIIEDYANGVITKDEAEYQINYYSKYKLFTWTSEKFDFLKTTRHGNEFYYDLMDWVYIPSFDVYIDGDYYVKVIVPSGEPKIISFEVPELEGSRNGKAKLTVKNIGNDVTTFIASIDCSGGVTVGENQKLIENVRPGNYGYTEFLLTAPEIDNELTYTCTVVVKDSVHPEKSDTDTKSNKIKPRSQKCREGEQTIKPNPHGGYDIYECDSTTGRFTIYVTSCYYGYKYNTKTGKYECVQPTPGPGPGPSPGPTPGTCEEEYEKCKNSCSPIDIFCPINCWLDYQICKLQRAVATIFMWVGAIVIVILIVLIVWKLASRKYPRIPSPPSMYPYRRWY